MRGMRLDDYLDAARARRDLPSDRALARDLGLAGQAVHNYRAARTWPSEETMLVLAEFAGVCPERALIDLLIWRSASAPKVQRVFVALRDRLNGVERQ